MNAGDILILTAVGVCTALILILQKVQKIAAI